MRIGKARPCRLWNYDTSRLRKSDAPDYIPSTVQIITSSGLLLFSVKFINLESITQNVAR